jgi:diaminopimelate epimerase
LTMACGTGTVASAVASIVRGDVSSPVLARVPGGELTIEWNGNGHAYMTGPAVHVFDTEV